ncbi:MAG: M24 family metallopeptidase [Candidatus Atribacteria bacterium]|nr:M24 family metallopeptidase [Candidatus Atribacteria bacterium]
MSSRWVLLVMASVSLLLAGFHTHAQEARTRDEMMRQIRTEKFDLVLPGAMRDNKVDMWIHVVRAGDPDPLDLDLGAHPGCPSPSLATRCLGYIVFTDRGGERIERALFNASGDQGLYDIRNRVDALTKFVAERDPKRIAVNMSEWLTVADGMSHTGYLTLVKLLGDTYAKRLVSAENVISDFRVRRVQTEIVAFAKACEMTREIEEAVFARIVPEVTTQEELGWWVQDQLLARGLITMPSGAPAPTALPGITRTMEGGRPGAQRRTVYHRGDMLVWDWGLQYLNYHSDIKRHAYILREEETDIPEGIRNAWDQGMKVRAVIRRQLKIGRTAGETLKAIAHALEEAGFGYIPEDPSTDGGLFGVKPGAQIKLPDKTEVSVDCHCVGETGSSQIAVGPSIAPHRPDRAKVMIQPNNIFSFEFVCYIPVPGWKEKMRLNLEDNAIITERGVEFLYPTEDRLIVIR